MLNVALLRRRRIGGNAAFTPASLFANGEQGAWYEFGPATCFTDTAGTTPCGAGDAIARINDSSGNGNHVTQPTAASRPILRQTVGGLWYADFDGVDDFLQSAPTGWAATQTAWMTAGASSSHASTSTRCCIAGISNGSYGSATGGEFSAIEVNLSGNNRWMFADIGSMEDSISASAGTLTDVCVLSGYSDGTNAKLRRDGVEVATAATEITSAIMDLNQEIDIGAFDNSGSITDNSPLNLFCLIIRLAPPSTQEISDTESYIANLSVAPGTAPAVADGQSWTVDDTSVNIDASGSGANLTFSYALNGVPSGVTINSGTGAITGTPTAVLSGTATVTATDQYGRTLTDTFTFTSALRAQATAADGLGPFSWTVDDTAVSENAALDFTANSNTLTYSATGLPTGVTIASNGTISGTPTAASSGLITITATDEYGRETTSATNHTTALRSQATAASGLGPYAFNVDSAITNQDLSADFTANGNTLTYTISPALPTGLSLASNGILSGTPTATAASASYTVTGQDEYGRETTSVFMLEVTDAAPPIEIPGGFGLFGKDAQYFQNSSGTLTPAGVGDPVGCVTAQQQEAGVTFATIVGPYAYEDTAAERPARQAGGGLTYDQTASQHLLLLNEFYSDKTAVAFVIRPDGDAAAQLFVDDDAAGNFILEYDSASTDAIFANSGATPQLWVNGVQWLNAIQADLQSFLAAEATAGRDVYVLAKGVDFAAWAGDAKIGGAFNGAIKEALFFDPPTDADEIALSDLIMAQDDVTIDNQRNVTAAEAAVAAGGALFGGEPNPRSIIIGKGWIITDGGIA